MFGSRVTLFKLAGFKVNVDLSWALLALLIAWSLAEGYFPSLYEGLPAVTYWWMGLTGVIGLFLSIILHELAHSLVARQYGLPIGGITLFIFGGVAEMENEPVNPKVEFIMAIAGPISSALIAMAFYVLTVAGSNSGFPEPVLAVTRYLTLLNSLLAIFNMVPAFPLDGGRMLRAALWWWWGNLVRATYIASRMGIGFGWILIGLGILNALSGNFIPGMWWFLIGLFIQGIAKGSYFHLMMRETVSGEPIARFMTENPIAVEASTSIHDLVENYVYKYGFDLFPVTVGSRLVGGVTIHQIKEVPRENWDVIRVGDVAFRRAPDNTIAATEDATKALSKMQKNRISRLMVVDGNRLVGIVSLKDMLRLLALRLDLESGETSGTRSGYQ